MLTNITRYQPLFNFIIINLTLFGALAALSLVLIGALSILFSRNSIYGLFNFILIIFAVLFTLIFLNLQFLPLTFLVIYIGAIAVLFLFIIIILQVKSFEFKAPINWSAYLNTSFIILLVGGVFTYYLALLGNLSGAISSLVEDFSGFILNLYNHTIYSSPIEFYHNRAVDIGFLINLFTEYAFGFWLIILILLISIIGSILLTTGPRTPAA